MTPALAAAFLLLRTRRRDRAERASRSAAAQQQAAAIAASQASYQATVTQSPVQAAVTKAGLSPLHWVVAAPAPPGAQTISRGSGIRGILPSDLAQLGHAATTASSAYHSGTSTTAQQQAAATVAQAKSWLAQIQSTQQQWIAAHPRPGPTSEPADVAAWLKGAGLSPTQAYPEWQWHVVQKGPPPSSPFGAGLFEPGEAIAAVDLGDHNTATWYVHPSGAWEYHHVWGQSLGDILSSIANAIDGVLADVATVISDVVQVAQIVASFVPGLGQVVNEVVTLGEAALDAISGQNALQIALDTTYHGIIGAIPGGEALTPILDPVVSALKSMAGGSSVGKAVLQQAIAQVPAEPNIAGYSPQSIAGGLASWMASKLGLT